MPYALVTGASKGIGRAIADELAARGFDLLLVARSEELLQKTQAELTNKYSVGVHYLATDLSAANAAAVLLDWCEQKKIEVSALVNNAGYGLSGPFEGHSPALTTNMMQLNMTTLITLCHAFLPMLKRQPKAYILNISSTTAYQALPLMSVYAASKVFVLHFSRGLHHELRNTSVSVTCVSPGSTDTDFPNRAQVSEKALKAAQKINMTPQAVAKIAVEAMLAGKNEVIAGAINKIGAFFAWLLPKSIVEKTAAAIYEA